MPPGPQDDNASVEDPHDLNRRRRFQQIHDARERFPEIRREHRERVITNEDARNPDGEITQRRYREIVANALVDYLSEVEPLLLRAHNTEPERGDEDGPGPGAYYDSRAIRTDDGDITLRNILEHNGKPLGEPLTIQQSRSAYRLCNQFLADVGLDLDFERGLPQHSSFDTTGSEDDTGHLEYRSSEVNA
jgi:hypothetical protein